MRFQLLDIQPEHDSAIREIIQAGGEEFGTIGDGFGPSDAEVQAMSQHYGGNRSQYLVAIVDGQVVGGEGFNCLDAASQTCELRKLFVGPRARGFGIGKAITTRCLELATQAGYSQCYLDTASNMLTAQLLYQSLGFKYLDAPWENAVHHGCDVWMLKPL